MINNDPFSPHTETYTVGDTGTIVDKETPVSATSTQSLSVKKTDDARAAHMPEAVKGKSSFLSFSAARKAFGAAKAGFYAIMPEFIKKRFIIDYDKTECNSLAKTMVTLLNGKDTDFELFYKDLPRTQYWLNNNLEVDVGLKVGTKKLKTQIAKNEKMIESTQMMISEKQMQLSELGRKAESIIHEIKNGVLSLESERESLALKLSQINQKRLKLSSEIEEGNSSLINLNMENEKLENELRTTQPENQRSAFCQKLNDQFGEQGFKNLSLLATQSLAADFFFEAQKQFMSRGLYLVQNAEISPTVNIFQDVNQDVHVEYICGFKVYPYKDSLPNPETDQPVSEKNYILKLEIAISKKELNKSWLEGGTPESFRVENASIAPK